MPEFRIRPVSQKEQVTLEQLSSLSIPDLYTQFGQQLGTLSPGASAETQARSWFASQKAKLHKLICLRGNYCAFIAKNRNDKSVEVVAALSDLLASTFSGVPIYTLATLLVRMGLDEFCMCDSAKGS